MKISTLNMQCPHCQYTNTCHAGVHGSTPGDGDLSLCWQCKYWSLFVSVDGVLRLRKPTLEEAADILEDPALAAYVKIATEEPGPLAAVERSKRLT